MTSLSIAENAKIWRLPGLKLLKYGLRYLSLVLLFCERWVLFVPFPKAYIAFFMDPKYGFYSFLILVVFVENTLIMVKPII